MHRRLKGFDFGYIQTPDIGVTWPWTLNCFLRVLENHSKYFDDFTYWLSGEQSLPFGLLVPSVKLCFI